MDAKVTDAELIARSSGDPDRFMLIFERHYSTVYRFVRRRIGAGDAEDLAAETFSQAFSTRDSFKPPQHSSCLPWLYGICTNLLRHHLRKEDAELRKVARLGAQQPEYDADALLDSVLDASLAEALLTIEPCDRETLLLYSLAELDYKEIATALEVPVGTVRSRLNRARKQLRESLAPDHEPALALGTTSDERTPQ